MAWPIRGRTQGLASILITEYHFNMTTKRNMHGGARIGAGRPPLQEGEATVVVTTKMTAMQRDKLQRLGGSAWIRERIDKARDPKG